MTSYTFTLVLDGPSLEDADLDRLFDLGCDDAIFGERAGMQVAEFDRSAPTFASALVSAISDVEEALPTATVVRVEPDDLVTTATIAERTGRTRESIRLLASADRGPGGFPQPLTWLDGSSKVWQWSHVSRWFASQLGETVGLGGAPQFVAALNGVLETRRQLAALPALASSSDVEFKPVFTSAELTALSTMVSDTAAAVCRDLAGVSDRLASDAD